MDPLRPWRRICQSPPRKNMAALVLRSHITERQGGAQIAQHLEVVGNQMVLDRALHGCGPTPVRRRLMLCMCGRLTSALLQGNMWLRLLSLPVRPFQLLGSLAQGSHRSRDVHSHPLHSSQRLTPSAVMRLGAEEREISTQRGESVKHNGRVLLHKFMPTGPATDFQRELKDVVRILLPTLVALHAPNSMLHMSVCDVWVSISLLVFVSAIRVCCACMPLFACMTRLWLESG